MVNLFLHLSNCWPFLQMEIPTTRDSPSCVDDSKPCPLFRRCDFFSIRRSQHERGMDKMRRRLQAGHQVVVRTFPDDSSSLFFVMQCPSLSFHPRRSILSSKVQPEWPWSKACHVKKYLRNFSNDPRKYILPSVGSGSVQLDLLSPIKYIGQMISKEA